MVSVILSFSLYLLAFVQDFVFCLVIMLVPLCFEELGLTHPGPKNPLEEFVYLTLKIKMKVLVLVLPVV